MTIEVEVEIRSALKSETRHFEATTKNGVVMPAVDFENAYYTAEFNEEMCMVRLMRGHADPNDPIRTWQRGEVHTLQVARFETVKDVPTFWV